MLIWVFFGRKEKRIMSQGKTFLKVLGMESLYMLLLTLSAAGAALLQSCFKAYGGEYSNIIFSGSNYRYNFFMYIIGILVYFGIVIFLYKKCFNYITSCFIFKICENYISRISLKRFFPLATASSVNARASMLFEGFAHALVLEISFMSFAPSFFVTNCASLLLFDER